MCYRRIYLYGEDAAPATLKYWRDLIPTFIGSLWEESALIEDGAKQIGRGVTRRKANPLLRGYITDIRFYWEVIGSLASEEPTLTVDVIHRTCNQAFILS